MAQYDGSVRIITEISTEAAKKSLGTLSNTIVKTAKEINSLRSKMDALKGQKFYTDDYKKLQSDLALVEKNLSELVTKQDEWEKLGITSGGAWDALNEEIAKASDNVDAIKEKMYQLEESGKAFNMGEETQEYANLERQLQYEEEALRQAQELQAVAQRTGDPYARLSTALNDLSISLSKVLHPIEAMKSSFASAAENIKARAAGVAATIINGIAHPFQTMKNIASTAINGTSKLLSGMASIAKKVGSAIKSMVSYLKKAVSSMSLFGKSTKSSNNMLGSGFKALLKYGLGIRSLYLLVNKFRTAVKEGFSNLAQYSAPVNTAISSLKSALTQLKNSLATAFAPILTAIAPALTTLINLASRAATAVGMLIAALTGQKSFVKATAVQEDYASSLGDTASNAKEANKQLSGLDKLNNLSSNDSAGSGGGGGGGTGAGDMFETVDIPSKISDLAKMIKDAWEKADFTEIGALIGTKLKDALDNIPWDKIQATAAKIGKSLATLINGFVEVEGLGYTIGQTIGEAINTGIIGINAFLDNTHWDSVGKFIGEGLNGIVNTIDWKGLGHLFAASFNAIFETIGEAAKTFEWSNLGKNLASSINKFISDFDWIGNGAYLGELIKGLLDSLIALLKETNWQELGEKVADFIGSIDWTGIAERIAEGIGAAIGGLAALIWGFIKDAWQIVVDWWYEHAFEDGKFTISGLLNGILESVMEIGDWLYEHVYLPFKEGFESTFGTHEISEITNNEMELAKEGAKAIWDLANADLFTKWELLKAGASKVFEDIKNDVLEKWELVKIGTPIAWENIKESLLQKWELVKAGAKKVFEDIKESILKNWELTKVGTSEVWDNVKTQLSKKWELIKTGASTVFGKIKESILKQWELVKAGTSSIWNGIKSAIKTPINAIIGFINSMISGIVNGMNSLIRMLNKFSIDIPDNPITGAVSLGINIPELSAVKIPVLATGAVIPPNKEFLAVLGDQKRGTNIEAPLDTIVDAMKIALKGSEFGSGNEKITIEIPVILDSREVTKAVVEYDREYFKRTGKPLFSY